MVFKGIRNYRRVIYSFLFLQCLKNNIFRHCFNPKEGLIPRSLLRGASLTELRIQKF